MGVARAVSIKHLKPVTSRRQQSPVSGTAAPFRLDMTAGYRRHARATAQSGDARTYFTTHRRIGISGRPHQQLSGIKYNRK
jgi:hypothetical protein